jgi:hypothetical protein
MRSTALCSRKLYAEKDQRYNEKDGIGTDADIGQIGDIDAGTETAPVKGLGNRSTSPRGLSQGLAWQTWLDA